MVSERSKTLPIVWFYLYGIFRIGKPIETERRLDWWLLGAGRTGDWEVILPNGYFILG